MRERVFFFFPFVPSCIRAFALSSLHNDILSITLHYSGLYRNGLEVVMEYCDHLANGQPVNQGQIDRYITSGKGREIFRNKFNYHGFQYVIISNLPVQPSLDDICAFLIQTDFQDAASFQCSDPDMNAIHDMIQYTLRLYQSGMLPC